MSSFSFRSRAAVIAAAASLACGAVMAQPSVDQDDPWLGSFPWMWTQVINEAEGVVVWTFGYRSDTNGTHDGWVPLEAADGGSYAWVSANLGSTDPEDVDADEQ